MWSLNLFMVLLMQAGPAAALKPCGVTAIRLPSHRSTACDSPTFGSTTRAGGVSVGCRAPPERISG